MNDEKQVPNIYKSCILKTNISILQGVPQHVTHTTEIITTHTAH